MNKCTLLSLTVAVAIVASACGSSDNGDLTTTAATLSDAAYNAFIAQTEPLAPDGGALVPCDDVPEMEARVDGTLGGRQNLDDDATSVLVTYWREHLDTFGGMWIDRAHGGAVVLTFTDDPEAHREAILARAPSPDGYPAASPRPPIVDDRPLGERDDIVIDVQQVAFTDAQLQATQAHLVEYMGPEYGLMGMSGTVQQNRISLEFVDPPDGAIEAIGELVASAAVCTTVTRTPEPPDGPLSVIPDLDTEDPLVTCSGIPPIPYSALVNPTPIAEVEHPAVDALRGELAAGGPESLPEGDWVVIDIDDNRADFAALGDGTFGTASFELQSGRWVLAGWSAGSSCEPVVALPDGLGRVEIHLDPDAPPEPADTVIHLLVTEVDCASGREMGDALIGPQVVETDDAVLVAFAVIPVVGGADCQGNPSTPVTITLAAPLGDRELLDGARVPPQALTERSN
jgi:hypothetical protein